MKRLLNRSEEDALKQLNEIAGRHGLQVHTKVRIADVCPIEKSGISDELYRYALMAHFDFIVADESYYPKFAVEFDGPNHSENRAKIRDKKKNSLCKIFDFPILRINNSYLPKQYNQISLLEWIIDVYHLKNAFYEAQKKGHVPYDELFDPFFLIMTGSNGNERKFPYWISRDANISIKRLHRKGKIALPGTSGFIGEDEEQNIRGIEFLKVNETHGIVVTTTMQAQQFPVSFADLVEELILIFLHEKLQEYLATGGGLKPLNIIFRLARLYQSKFKMLSAHSTG